MGGGSLLNDLLSDLDAAITANELITHDDPTDDLFASLKKDLDVPTATSSSAVSGPPGLISGGAFVMSRQTPADLSATTTTAAAGQDAWSAALAQFGGMSLAEEFLAADTAKKQQLKKADTTNNDSTIPENNVVDNNMVFDDYELDQEAQVKNMDDETGGLMALLGASRAKSQQEQQMKEVKKKKEEEEVAAAAVLQSPQATGVKAPPPSPMMPPPIVPTGMPVPMAFPGGPPPNTIMMPPGVMMSPNMMPPMGGMPPPPPGAMPVMGPPPHMMMMPPNYGNKPTAPLSAPPPRTQGGKEDTTTVLKNRDFPALGATPQEIEECKAAAAEPEPQEPTPPTPNNVRPHILFNNPDPSAPPINASLVSSALMPSRDITFVVNAMMRPLLSLDAYNDDYYHWSYVDRKSRDMLMLGGMNPALVTGPALPNPVWKEVKVQAVERELKYRESMDARSKEFAEEKKSLGRLVKSNVNRPKALLVTSALKKDDDDGAEEEKVESSSGYEAEQKRLRIQTWKARVAIDKGYTAFLTLTELRRLIQANAGATQLIHELTGDVKANVNLMHASFGIIIKNDDVKGGRKIDVDSNRLESTLSMPKGRTLFARVVEGGILPHASACELLPVAMGCVFKNALPAVEGEERLLRALTGLVLTPQPSVEPGILAKCLDVAIMVGSKDVAVDGKKMPNITGSRTRMELLHAILARGKAVCGDNEAFGWDEKEKQFMALLT
jgi:hypothetical protein